MIELNLKAETPEQKKIKAYLQANASDILANKINNGVRIQKNGKTLISKKTLAGFMAYAESEARKLAAKGAKCACIDDPTVYGWAIHYFEENSIEGKLYNEDGSEYQTKSTVAPSKPVAPPKPKPEPQLSMFDMLSEQKKETPAPIEITDQTYDHEPVEEADDEDDEEGLNDDYTCEELEEENDEEPTEEEINEAMEQEKQISLPLPPIQTRRVAWYEHYLSVKAKYKDCILFYRPGDFYELYGDDATTAAKLLDLTLTGRDCGLTERVPLAGVPYHAADAYVAKLVNCGYKIAIAERINNEFQERIVKPQTTELLIDEETGEVLEDASVPTVTKIVSELGANKTTLGAKAEDIKQAGQILQQFEETTDDDDDDLPPIDTKAFEPEALSILDELFGNSMILR